MTSAQRDAIDRTRLSSEHEILGVPRSADEATLRKAYKAMCKLLHPDKNQLPGAEAAFKRVADAFNALISRAPPVPTGASASAETTGSGTSVPTPAGQGDRGTKAFGCAKCRWSVAGCAKCRHDGQGGKVGRAFKVHVAPPPMVPRSAAPRSWAGAAATARANAAPQQNRPPAPAPASKPFVADRAATVEESSEEEEESEDDSSGADEDGGLSFAAGSAAVGYVDESTDDSDGLEALGDGTASASELRAAHRKAPRARKEHRQKRPPLRKRRKASSDDGESPSSIGQRGIAQSGDRTLTLASSSPSVSPWPSCVPRSGWLPRASRHAGQYSRCSARTKTPRPSSRPSTGAGLACPTTQRSSSAQWTSAR